MKNLKINKNFKPCSVETGDELYPNGIVEFNITRMIEYLQKNPVVPIVSSEHLTSPDSRHLSEFEYGMIIVHNAFSRWVIRCMNAAGYRDFSPSTSLLRLLSGFCDQAPRSAASL